MKLADRLDVMGLGKRNLQPVLGAVVEDLVRSDHPYRILMGIVPFDVLCKPLEALYGVKGRDGYPPCSMFKSLLLQWMEDLSDRELERFLDENLAGKLFCGFELGDKVPDHSSFGEMRRRVGTEHLAHLFNRVRDSLKDAGLIREVFTFVDATHLIAKENLWRERDQLIAQGEKKLSNSSIARVAADPEARLGKKGKFRWFGYKIHASVDMTQGLICRVAVTAANVDDTKAARHVLPRAGMVFGDKAFGVGDSAKAMRRLGLHCGAILRNDMTAKNHDKDRWLTSVRMPYEGTWSKMEKRARYRGTVKCQFQAFMEAVTHNFKRLVTLKATPLILRPSCA